jgi:hypothetical protein
MSSTDIQMAPRAEQLSLLDEATPPPKSEPEPEPRRVVCECDGRLVELDEELGLWCLLCGRRKA